MGFIEDIRDFINSFASSEPKMTDKKKAKWAYEENKKETVMEKRSAPDRKKKR